MGQSIVNWSFGENVFSWIYKKNHLILNCFDHKWASQNTKTNWASTTEPSPLNNEITTCLLHLCYRSVPGNVYVDSSTLINCVFKRVHPPHSSHLAVNKLSSVQLQLQNGQIQLTSAFGASIKCSHRFQVPSDSILRKRTCKLVGNGLWGNHR